jgi:hypothetical protein
MGLILKAETKFFCHVFTTKPGKADNIRETLMEAVRNFILFSFCFLPC